MTAPVQGGLRLGFKLTNVAGSPFAVVAADGTSDMKSDGTFAPLEVKVTPSFGNLLRGIPVTFTVQNAASGRRAASTAKRWRPCTPIPRDGPAHRR